MKENRSGSRTVWMVLALAGGLAGRAQADVVVTKGAVERGRRLNRQRKPEKPARPSGPNATGSIALTDQGGLQYFINTNITFSTSSSASGAMYEASYTGPVSATTSMGGNTMTTLNDAFDGYNALCISTTGATGPCATGDPNYLIYVMNAAASLDATCSNRQVIFPPKTLGGISVQRKVFVPSNDQFARWLNTFTNTTGSPITFNMITSNNLGSDANTRVVTTSSGDALATTADTWVTSFQNYSGTTSSDVRLGHVFWGPGGATGLSAVNFVDGDDNPYWTYTITLNAGQTKTIMNFVTGQPSKAAAAAKVAQIVGLPPSTLQCMSQTEQQQVVNFITGVPVVQIPAVSKAGLAALAVALTGAALWALKRR